jgi:hypothetical protein
MSDALDQLVRETADLLRPFSEDLADAFVADPFRRVDLAFAFAAGLAKHETDDVHPTAATVLQVALFDRDRRAATQGGDA